MVKALMSVIGLLFASNVYAAPMEMDYVVATQAAVVQNTNFAGIDFKVGDTASYDLTMAIFIKGTMTTTIASITEEGVWMHQEIELAKKVKQQIQTLIDAQTGVTKKIVINGKEQAAPKQEIEVIDTTEERITVPAGTFDAMHVTAQNKSSGKNNEVNIWINPQVIPVGGTIKQVVGTPLGKMTTVLRSFIKN